ncbi:hypothetical protein MD484_g8919, partial [Candolleomyces efflorescens]
MEKELEQIKAQLEEVQRQLLEAKKESSPKELRINTPTSYSGKRSEFPAFVDAFKIYLNINKNLYDTDEKKIAFVLSYFDKGEPAQWKTSFIRTKTQPDDTINLGSWSDFLKKLNDDFREIDEEGDALYQLEILRQGARPAEDLASKFRIVAHKAKLLEGRDGETAERDPTDIMLRAHFKKALTPGLLRKILELETQPKTLEELIAKAIKFDNQWRRTNTTFKTQRQVRRMETLTNQTYASNPSQVSIARLTLEEREELRKKGDCFFCKEHGHMAKDCPKVTKQNENKTHQTPRWSAERTIAKIRQIGAEIPEEERDNFKDKIDENF